METALRILLLALCVSSLVWLIISKIRKGGMSFVWTKTIASAVFVISAFISVALKTTISPCNLLILLGLVCGMIGDILLALKEIYKPHEAQYLNGGFLSFAIGHLCYMIGFGIYANSKAELLVPIFVAVAIGAVIATIIIVNSRNMGLDFGNFSLQTKAYTFVLCITTCFMVSFAIMVSKLWIVATALLLFLLSDLFLSFIYFAPRKSTNTNWALNLSTYYVAQILIVAFLMFV